MIRFRQSIERSSPTILCIIAAAGVVGTAVLTAIQKPKADKKLEEAKQDRLSKAETFMAVAPVYLPPVGVGLGTIVCIFGANALNRRQQASIASALLLMERSFNEYKNKTIELLGSDKEIREEIAKDHLKDVKPEDDGLELFYEPFSCRYFRSSMEEVREAEYFTNRLFILRGDASINDYFEYLDLDRISGGDDIGWDQYTGEITYGYQWIDFTHDKIVTDDGLECWMINYPFWPHEAEE